MLPSATPRPPGRNDSGPGQAAEREDDDRVPEREVEAQATYADVGGQALAEPRSCREGGHPDEQRRLQQRSRCDGCFAEPREALEQRAADDEHDHGHAGQSHSEQRPAVRARPRDDREHDHARRVRHTLGEHDRHRPAHGHSERALQQPALEQLTELCGRDRPEQSSREDREAATRRHLDVEARQIALPPPEAQQVVERGQREREREELPAKARQLVAELAEVGIEAEPDGDGHRKGGDEYEPALQVKARITAAVAIQPATARMIGTSVRSTCSGSSPMSSRCTSSR